MRRLLRSVFLLLLVATLVAPLPAGESAAAPAPICCLMQGEHHCMGQMLGAPDAPGFSASNKCPYAPLALAAMHGPHLAPPVRAQVVAAVAQSAPIALDSKSSAFSSAIATRPQRGPPAFSLN